MLSYNIFSKIVIFFFKARLYINLFIKKVESVCINILSTLVIVSFDYLKIKEYCVNSSWNRLFSRRGATFIFASEFNVQL